MYTHVICARIARKIPIHFTYRNTSTCDKLQNAQTIKFKLSYTIGVICPDTKMLSIFPTTVFYAHVDAYTNSTLVCISIQHTFHYS